MVDMVGLISMSRQCIQQMTLLIHCNELHWKRKKGRWLFYELCWIGMLGGGYNSSKAIQDNFASPFLY